MQQRLYALGSQPYPVLFSHGRPRQFVRPRCTERQQLGPQLFRHGQIMGGE
ncbi:hypothetical protein D3C84_363830 [compost metagenome]